MLSTNDSQRGADALAAATPTLGTMARQDSRLVVFESTHSLQHKKDATLLDLMA